MHNFDDDERSAARTFRRRALLVGAGQAAAFSLVGWRLFDLQVLGQGRYGPLAEENRLSLQVMAPKRGRILDRAARVLADNDEIFRVVLTPALARDIDAVLSDVRHIVPIDDGEIASIKRRIKKQSRNSPTVIAGDVTFEQIARLGLLAPQLPGIRTEVAWRRRYHGGAPVAHIVGYVGSVEKFGIDDEAVLRLPEMRIGKAGVEAGFESELRGDGGTQKIEVDARGRIVRNLGSTDPLPGRDVVLSIDAELQRGVLERLQRERRAAVVMLDVESGEVVAMASTPGFSSADIVDGITDESWRRLTASEDKPLLNRAVAGQYPPGSTFKVVTALAALKAQQATLSESVRCDGHFEYAGQTYRCWNRAGHGAMSMHEAIRSSCDVYFFEMARRLGIEALADAARLLGLGVTFDCGLPDEKAGLVPDPDWKRGRWNANWFGGETILAGIGQGYLLTTPLQLAVMTARVATGKTVMPTIRRRDAGVPHTDFARLAFDESHLSAVRAGMFACVNESGGTGGNAALGSRLPMVAGKTGTSQVSRLSSETAQDELPWSQRDHGLFVAYAPAENPKYAAAAIVEHGGGGGATAAPVVRDVFEMLFQRRLSDDTPSPPRRTG